MNTPHRFLQVWSVLVLLAAWLVAGVGCSDDYGQDTPDQTIRTAKMLVEKGKAKQLSTLIYAENENWRKLMRRTGVFLGNIQTLGNELEMAFPKEVGELRERAKTAAAEGKATSLVGVLSKQAMGGRRKRPSEKERAEMEQAMQDAMKRLFADPYAWLKEADGRLTTVPVNDNTAALMWDGQTVMPPLGMIMKKAEDGKWYFVLPTNLPGVNQFMPKTEKEFRLWGSIITTFDNVVIDLTKDVREKRLTNFEMVAMKAGEKAFIPAAMTFAAYGAYLDAKKRETKAQQETPVKTGG